MYLMLLIFLPAILIPASASSRPVFLMMHSAYKLNKQGDNIQPWYTPFSIWNQSVVCCSMRLSEGSNKPCALQDPETPQRLRQKLHSTSQSQTCIKKSRTHCLVVCYPSATTFWILVKPLHLRSILSKLTTWIENCNACSWHESTERAQFFSRTMPNRITHNQHFESWTNLGYEILPPLPHSPDLSLTNYHLFSRLNQIFLQGKCFYIQQEAEDTFQEFFESQSMDFSAAEINQRFLFGKTRLIVMVPNFD